MLVEIAVDVVLAAIGVVQAAAIAGRAMETVTGAIVAAAIGVKAGPIDPAPNDQVARRVPDPIDRPPGGPGD